MKIDEMRATGRRLPAYLLLSSGVPDTLDFFFLPGCLGTVPGMANPLKSRLQSSHKRL
ncbi:MAG TPA: hypothetical protein VJT74_16690 [Pyrinomonadaceae bacterium]|nr:hypothetical protein [Pyrinomonadaceae bacterium]